MSDRPSPNYVRVLMSTESGCDVHQGEYSLLITSFAGALHITAPGGLDDPSLIVDCIENSLDEIDPPEEGHREILLRESGEWEDVFWNKYYVVENVEVIG